MKNLLVVIVLTMFSGCSFGQSQKELVTLSITVSDIPDKKSKIYVGFYTAENDFPKHGKHAFRKVVEANGNSSITVTWDDIPKGEYAIAVYQDLNNNDKLETGFMGMPKEPAGLSTNLKPGMFNIPNFKKCKVSVANGSQLNIVLRS
jgi:uncharacterized protein (DUF2141 family)